MQECLSAVLPDVFAGGLAESVRRVQAWVLDDNGRSSGLLQKLGFRHEGTLRELFHHTDKHCNVRCYGLLSSDDAHFGAIATTRVEMFQQSVAC
jgi:ribosomal-protein-alanine N-acetyltransferase